MAEKKHIDTRVFRIAHVLRTEPCGNIFQVEIRCPFCGETHTHSADEATGPVHRELGGRVLGARLPHCAYPHQRKPSEEYILVAPVTR
jgi:hypothetical protein